MALGAAGAMTACTIKVEENTNPDPPPPIETRTFRGDVYDGVTGTHITEEYDIAVDFNGQYLHGTLDARGGFHLPVIPALQDFSVFIDKTGYRPFVAHQAQWLDQVHGDRSFYYLAYMFADNVPVADVPFMITLTNSTKLPSGQLRLRPTDISAVYDDPVEQPGGVPGQVWQNDNDLLTRTVYIDFADGAVLVPGTSLVYGVPYQVSVFNVPGYQIFQNSIFQAGVNSRMAVELSRLTVPALDVSYVSTQSGDPSPDGTVTIVLNQPAQFDPTEQMLEIKNSIDNGFSITSPNTNGDLQRNILNVNTDPNVQAKGTSIEITPIDPATMPPSGGQTIVLKWNRARGLLTSDPGDRIDTITYGGLAGVRLRPYGGNAADVVTLASILGSASIVVPLTP
jgi:hypothetical protein